MAHLWMGIVVAATTACAIKDEAPDPTATAEQSLTTVADRRLLRDLVVVAVRHAERGTDDPVDPMLSDAGQARAESLAAALEHADITAIFTTQYLRTRQTAAPLAEATGTAVTVRAIDNTNAATYTADLAREIRHLDRTGAVLVVGHSNTIPELVAALSGVTVPPIAEAEHDRVYTLTVGLHTRLVATKY